MSCYNIFTDKPLHLKFTEIKAGPVKLCEKPCQAMYVLFCEDMLKWLPLCKLFSSLQIVFFFHQTYAAGLFFFYDYYFRVGRATGNLKDNMHVSSLLRRR